jgi:hypothetical protein
MRAPHRRAPRRRTRATIATLAAGVALLVVPVTATATATSSGVAAATISCARAAERVPLSTSAVLDPTCTWSGGFDIVGSGVTLDCNGARLEYHGPDRRSAINVVVEAGADLADVVIRHCDIHGFGHGIELIRNGANHLAAGEEYDHHLRNVVIEDTTLTGARGVGIYVHPYVTDTQIRRTVVNDSWSAAVYLDAGSRRATVEHNVFVHNGHVESGPGGWTSVLAGLTFRSWGPGREGVAIDGSSDNVIRRNWIVDSAAGGVFVYTNCGENVTVDPASWLDHRYGAERNVIAGNVIVGGRTGVWIGSRMGENVLTMDCSDVPYAVGPLRAITLDRAPHTTAFGNVIIATDFGVRVEDDGAIVAANRIIADDPAAAAIVVGTPYRTTALGRPVTDTVVVANRAEITANVSPYRWVDGVGALWEDANLAHGAPSRFCPAPTIARGPFVMVDAFALEDPNGPPVDPPPFERPRLGVLAPCA